MKKRFLLLISFVIVLCLSFALFSCGDEEVDSDSGSSSISQEIKNPASSKSETKSSGSQKDEKPDEDDKSDKIDYMKYKFFVANDFDPELYSIGVKKGNTALLAEINSVIALWLDNGTMKDYIDYYTNLDLYLNNKIDKMPEQGDLKTSWDFEGATEAITVYTSSGFAPFEFTVDGEIVGVDIAIMSQVAENMGKRIEIKDMDFDSIFLKTAIHEGDAAAAAGIVANETREQFLDFSDFYSDGYITIASKNNQYELIEQLQPLRIGTIQEYLKYYEIVDSDISVYQTVEEAFLALEAGEVDALAFVSYSCLFASFYLERK